MQKKKNLMMAVLLCVIGIYAARIYVVNTDKKLPERQIFEKGESVPYERDYNISENDMCEGYYVKVLDTEIMEAKAFCEKYDAMDMGLATHYYMVNLEVENRSNERVGEEGVALGMAMLTGENYAIIPSLEMFEAANPGMAAPSFSLQYGTQKRIRLVFSIIPNNMPDYECIEEKPPMLQITQYPVQKYIKL